MNRPARLAGSVENDPKATFLRSATSARRRLLITAIANDHYGSIAVTGKVEDG
jgi:hypothetical protein